MPTGSSSRSGPPPKPPDKRRNTRTPGGYGLAEPVKNAGEAGKQPDLGFDPHFLVRDLWAALQGSVEARFYSAADWQRARAELFFMNEALASEKGLNASSWQRVQQGLNELLISPADKRRAGIELKAAADVDEDAAVLQIAKYQDKLAQ
jgi:hypothetical protein